MQTIMQKYMKEVLSNYEKIRGCDKNDIDIPFWDVIVITAADEDQKKVYEKQLNYKHKRNELPKGIPVLVVADPPGPKLGNGGSTMTALQLLYEKFGEDTFRHRVLLIHAGGQSQRMPSASVLGKIFSPVPKGNPVYQMLDMKLAMFLPLIPKMGPGVFVTCADDFLVYNLGQNHETIEFGRKGFTALAHPSSISVGTGHGVYVIKDINKVEPSRLLQNLECVEVLQKPNETFMYAKDAVLKSKELKFCDEIKIDGSVVYTDSSFYFAHDITEKLLKFLMENGPLDCEIDAYGDFLQSLGSRGTAEYVNNVSNVSCVTQNLVKTRQQIYDILHWSELTLLVMNSSKFIHIGTTKEYVDHFCCDRKFQSELGLGKDIFNLWIGNPHAQTGCHGEGDTDCFPSAKYRKLSDTLLGCVMHSCLPSNSSVSETAVVEFCNFSVPVKIGQNCILNNCEFDPMIEKGQGQSCKSAWGINEVQMVEFPNDLFMHTIPIICEDRTKYVTVVFDIKDNLKKVLPNKDVRKLSFLGKQVEDYTSLLSIDISTVMPGVDNPASKFNLWFLNLFPCTESSSESVWLALQCVNALKTDKPKMVSLASYKLVSMATILKEKDLDAMLENRDFLFNKIVTGRDVIQE